MSKPHTTHQVGFTDICRTIQQLQRTCSFHQHPKLDVSEAGVVLGGVVTPRGGLPQRWNEGRTCLRGYGRRERINIELESEQVIFLREKT